MKKNGIILMMTLVLITVMMGIVALILTRTSHFSTLASSSFSQTAALKIIDDLENILPTMLSRIQGAEELDLLMRIPLRLESKKGDFRLEVSLASPYARLNINRLVNPDGTLNESYLAAWERLFVLYPIGERDTLLMLVLDTLDNDLAERADYTEIKWNQPDFNNGMIASMEQFERIVERYLALTKDTAILSVPWENYIGFQGDKIDFNAVNPDTLSLFLPDVSPERIRQLTLYRTKAFTSKEEAVAAEPSLAGVFDTFFFIYDPHFAYTLLCDVRLAENGHTEHMRFRYRLSDKKIERVEFL